jgi:hypothetical protein
VRAIRGVVSIACLLACIGFAALWVRSHYWHDSLDWWRPDRYVGVRSWAGHVTHMSFQREPLSPMPGSPLGLTGARTDENSHAILTAAQGMIFEDRTLVLGFGYWQTAVESYMLTVPHWFLVAVSGALAVALKPKPRWRFSVRDLLFATTMIAVIVAALASLPRSY